ncbi:MAG TPA: carbohydrate-binding protein CenC, partial [Alphaproteobacteria bacterium]|nr:carbohydrate-binding protein CenC [Alphaproteobacteria bacterium]
ELLLCQRYYEKSYSVDTAPGTAGASAGALGMYNAASGVGAAMIATRFKASKRATPSVTNYSYNSGTAGNGYTSSGGADFTASASNIGTEGMNLSNGSSLTAGFLAYYQWAADAEL